MNHKKLTSFNFVAFRVKKYNLVAKHTINDDDQHLK